MDTESVLMNQNRSFQLNNEGIEKTLNQQVAGSIPASPIASLYCPAGSCFMLNLVCPLVACEAAQDSGGIQEWTRAKREHFSLGFLVLCFVRARTDVISLRGAPALLFDFHDGRSRTLT